MCGQNLALSIRERQLLELVKKQGMEISETQDSERKINRHRGQGCSGISHTRKESDLAEVSRDLMLLKGYRNMRLRTQRKHHQQL